MKGAKGLKRAHTPNTPFGMGDSYGSGVRQKVGRIKEGMGKALTSKKLGKPPKSLA
jgi:hypothetical protein